MSQTFEQVDFVRIFFKDGSCAFLKNHGLNVSAIITQLTDERDALAAENERLRKAGDVTIAAYCMGEKNVEKHKDNPVVAYWLAAKEGKPFTKHEDDIRRGLRTK